MGQAAVPPVRPRAGLFFRQTWDPMSNSQPAMKILLLGGRGLLGSALRAKLGALGALHSPSHQELDVTDPAAVTRALQQLRPKIVINCTAFSDVDGSESKSELAYAVNRDAAAVLVKAADSVAASLVHFSTDFVFDGERRTPYQEQDVPHPLSVYGRSKLAGEQAVLDSAGAHLVFRVSWLYGPGGKNFFSKIAEWLTEDRELRVVADQVSVPNDVRWLAGTLCELLREEAARPGYLAALRGLYHLSATGQASRYDFARAVADGMGPNVRARLTPVPASAFPMVAQRPAFSVLDAGRFARVFGIEPPDWRTVLEAGGSDPA